MKPQNILLDKNLNIKIADFGLARTFSIPIRPYTVPVVTLYYRAPEILLGASEYSTPIDIWALGCIFFEIVTKMPFICGDSETDQINRMFRILGTPNEEIWPGINNFKNYKLEFLPTYNKKPLKDHFENLYLDEMGMDLLERMLIYDPTKRITASSALEHPFFYEITKNYF